MLCVDLFWDGYYLPKKPCRPITYPDARRTTKTFSITTKDSLETVLEFYTQSLGVKPIFDADTGDWRMERLSDKRYLLSCYGADINGVSTESGCIYVSVDGSHTKIDGDLYRSEGSNIPCRRK